MKSSAEVKEYYDNYQFKIRHNIRHYIIINKLLDAGLKSNSRVLEIGCGNGALTKLIVKKVTTGKITSVDISSASIEQAKKNLAAYSNVSHVVADVADYNTTDKYDFIVFSDVLEHIPLENHNNLFKKVGEVLNEDGVVFINIPEPKFLEWIEKNAPEKLQVIDQPLHSDLLVSTAYKHGLYLKELKSYSIFHEPSDYQYIIFTRKNKTYDYVSFPKWRIILKKYQRLFTSRLK